MGNAGTVQMVLKKMQGLVENKSMLISVYINSVHIFVQIIFVFKNAIWVASFTIIIFHYMIL